MKSILESEIYRQDLLRGLEVLDFLSVLKEKTVLITGASGLICSCLIDMLLCCNQRTGAGIRVVAAGRRIDVLKERFSSFSDENIRYVSYDANCPIRFDCDADYVIHGACNAYPAVMSAQPVETMWSNIYGLYQLTEYARSHNTRRILMISSSEVYGNKQEDGTFAETEHGYVNINDSRSSYSVGKMAAETLCVSVGDEYGLDCVIARPGHIYGPTASRKDNRVSSMFAYAAAERKPIVMKSSGEQLRSYCYCVDCASALLTVLLKGKRNTAYNVANTDSVISIRQMSQILADTGGVELTFDIPTEAEKRSFNPMRNSGLKTTRLQSLGWNSLFPVEEGLSHTVKALREIIPE